MVHERRQAQRHIANGFTHLWTLEYFVHQQQHLCPVRRGKAFLTSLEIRRELPGKDATHIQQGSVDPLWDPLLLSGEVPRADVHSFQADLECNATCNATTTDLLTLRCLTCTGSILGQRERCLRITTTSACAHVSNKTCTLLPDLFFFKQLLFQDQDLT